MPFWQGGIVVRRSRDNWLPGIRERRTDVPTETIDKCFHSLWRAQPDFLCGVPRSFIRDCPTPTLVVSDDTISHPLRTSIDVASLAPASPHRRKKCKHL